jgi:hypothetical protein
VDNQIFLANEVGCSSFELKKTTKTYCWTIKVYHPDIQQGYNLAKNIDKQASKEYGISTDTTKEED